MSEGREQLREAFARIIGWTAKRAIGTPKKPLAEIIEFATDQCLALLGSSQGRTDPRSTDWRPIDSAPRDGSGLLMICASAYSPRATVGWWGGTSWRHYSRPDEKWHGGETTWFPTHWMPLPPAPAEGR